MKIVRSLYDWVLHWADTPYAMPALAILAFAESSFFPVPPDVLLIAMALSNHKKAWQFALICSVASVLGGMLGYLIGWGFWEVVRDPFYAYVPGFSEAKYETVGALFSKYDFWVIFTAGFSPIPYKLFTILAGVFKIDFLMFVIASTVSRSARFFIVAGLIYFFGPAIRVFIDKYFNLLSIAFVVLLIGAFLVIKVI